jgi:hypothetical protein
MPNMLEQNGILHVIEYETKMKRNPRNVSRDRKFVGYDILSKSSDGKALKIEVKSTFGKGIPDAYESEFSKDLRFVATHLYVVCFDKKTEDFKALHIIPKKEVNKYQKKHKVVQRVRFASALQTKLNHGEFKEPL